MVGDGTGPGHPVQSTEQVDQGILKTPALVLVEATWNSKLIKQLTETLKTWPPLRPIGLG